MSSKYQLPNIASSPKVANSLRLTKKSEKVRSLQTEETKELPEVSYQVNVSQRILPTTSSQFFQSSLNNPQYNQSQSSSYLLQRGSQPAAHLLQRSNSTSQVQGQTNTGISQLSRVTSGSRLMEGSRLGRIQLQQTQPGYMQLQQGQTQIAVNKEITYENKATKTTSYVQVPVYEAQYMEVQEDTVLVGIDCELVKLRLLLKEKDVELEVLRAKAGETQKEYKPMQNFNLNISEEDMDFKTKNEKLIIENRMFRQEIELKKSQIEELEGRLNFFQKKMAENEEKHERAKKGGAHKEPIETPTSPGIDPNLLRECAEKIEFLKKELLGKD